MISYPHDVNSLLRRQKALRRELAARHGLVDIRVAILGGSTTQEVGDLLDLFLLDAGLKPTIHHSRYNAYYEDTVHDSTEVVAFHPDVVIVYTSSVNLNARLPINAKEEDFESAVFAEMARFESIWRSLDDRLGCQVIQNNFEQPAHRVLGNLDSSALFGQTHFTSRMNLEFAKAARRRKRMLVHDLHSLSSSFGLSSWLDVARYHAYKLITTPAASVQVAHSLASMIGAIYGRSRKCLVLDLDNTLWGGVIGDDGQAGIRLGHETPEGEAFLAFQRYCKQLNERGVLLAVCSKNEPANAKEGLLHPDSLLRIEDFAAFKANWEPKHENIRAIAAELNIGLDSLVFIDDNPAERALVAAQLPEVAVPDVGAEVTRFAAILDGARFFEAVTVSAEDAERAERYRTSANTAALAAQFGNYDEYLASLRMEAEIAPFAPVFMERIAQLTNKTNQFNLTTRRYTQAELEAIAQDARYVTLYGRLRDAYGDHGLVSVIIGRQEEATLHIETWLMSCRVLKREMEHAMLAGLVAASKSRGISNLLGHYKKSPKNGMVADHYANLGFELLSRDVQDTSSTWRLTMDSGYVPHSQHIRSITHV